MLKQAAEHAHITHTMQDIPQEVVAKVRSAIRDEE
jgi:predicted small metal-binding protein